MKNPITRIVVAVVCAGIICQLLYLFYVKEIKKFQAHNTDRLTELLTAHTDHEMLFIGSSRTHFGIYPKIIDSICHTDSYNAGVEGGSLYEFEMMLRAYLENHPAPKYLILSVDLHSFNPAEPMFNYPVYFPYLQNRTIKKYLEANGHLTLMKKIFPFLKITDYDDDTKGSLIKALAGKTEIPSGDFQYKGYISNTAVTVDPEEKLPAKTAYEMTTEKKACLDSIISICKRNHTKLIMMYSPEYQQKIIQSVSNADQILGYLESYAAKQQLPFLREDRREICNDPLLFANFGHLNRDGAKVYSAILARSIDSIMHHN